MACITSGADSPAFDPNDPDVAQAVQDVLQLVMDLRAATVLAAAAGESHLLNRKVAANSRVQELTELIESRARSVYLGLDEILLLANQRIASDPRLPRTGPDRTAARAVLDLIRDRDLRVEEAEAARIAARDARAAVTRAEHRHRMADEALRVATGRAASRGMA